jgi:hypothetical protein
MAEMQNKAKIRRNNKKPKVPISCVHNAVCEVTEISEEEFNNWKPQTARQVNIQHTDYLEEIKPFDATGGFSKRNGKKELETEQAKADSEALRKRLVDLEAIYKEQHPRPKPWYLSFGHWIGILCGLAVAWLCYQFFVSEGGLPPEIVEFLINLGILR